MRGGDGGIDYDGACYIANGTCTNYGGVTMDSGSGGRSFNQGDGFGRQGGFKINSYIKNF